VAAEKPERSLNATSTDPAREHAVKCGCENDRKQESGDAKDGEDRHVGRNGRNQNCDGEYEERRQL
jgi:hypothetical protein